MMVWLLRTAVILGAGSACAIAQAPYVEGEVLVTFKPWRDEITVRESLKRHSLRLTTRFNALSDRSLKQTGVIRDKNRSTRELIDMLQNDPTVQVVEPNYLSVFSGEPNDPNFDVLWALKNTGQLVSGTSGTAGADIRFLEAWKLAPTTATTPVVAVVDTGTDRHHPDLAANLWVNEGEIPYNGVDDDGNGYTDDVYGYDVASASPNIMPSGTHGSHVAGIIAATGNNAKGIVGANDRVRIMTLKASATGNSLSIADEIEAYNYAILMKSRGVNVVAVNASFNGTSYSQSQRNAIVALETAGIVLVNSAGNGQGGGNGTNNDLLPVYPANHRLSNMIVVAASDQNDQLSQRSNFGINSVDLAAPGANILSTVPGSATGTVSLSVDGIAYQGYGLELSYASATPWPVTATLLDCGIGQAEDFPPEVSGNLALIQRGTITIDAKLDNAAAAGASGVVFYNNDGSIPYLTAGRAGDWLPACSISLADGEALQAMLPSSAVLSVPHQNSYGYNSGTSMAAPQVAAAVALAAMAYPGDTVQQRVQRVIASVELRPALIGKVNSGGRLNLQRLMDSDSNELPDWWEDEHFSVSTGNAPDGDEDSDGMTNLNEFLSGTDPVDGSSKLSIVASARNAAMNAATVTWSAVSGKTYQVYFSETLAEGSWEASLPNSRITALPGETTLSYTDETALSKQRFYRVQLVVE